MKKFFWLPAVLGFGCILWGMCFHFAFFQFSMGQSEGIFVDAFVLLGGKGVGFLALLLLFSVWYRGTASKKRYVLSALFLLLLFGLLQLWLSEIQTALQNAGTYEMSLQPGSGYFMVCAGFLVFFVHSALYARQF